jgi:spore coat polysaccharide biosynthesis protein SpsF
VFRSLALARELVDRGARVTFVVAETVDAVKLVEREGYPVTSSALTDLPRFDALVLDARGATPPRSEVDALRVQGVLIAAIDDPTERRLSADLVFYPPIPHVEDFGWDGFSGTRLVGGEWVVLRREFAEPPHRSPRTKPTVLVTMGGSDPAGMTLTALDGLKRSSEPFRITVVLGPGYRERQRLQEEVRGIGRPVVVYEQPSDMRALMLGADLAVAAYGVTAHELAATATPAVLMCLTADHEQSAIAFRDAGAAIVLGVYRGDEGPVVTREVSALITDPDRCEAMGRAGRQLIDGKGAARVADRILQELDDD